MNLGVEKQDSKSSFRYLHYQFNLGQRKPTLVYLHGAGEYGDDITSVCRFGLPLLISESKLLPTCDVICPQMELDQQWNVDRLHSLLSGLNESGHDIVLAGYSRGGTGVCDYLANYGSSLSLAVIIAGQGISSVKSTLNGLEIFSIMGEDDPWPRMNSFLTEATSKGAEVLDIRLQGRGHFISEEVFLGGELLKTLSRYQIYFHQLEVKKRD